MRDGFCFLRAPQVALHQLLHQFRWNDSWHSIWCALFKQTHVFLRLVIQLHPSRNLFRSNEVSCVVQQPLPFRFVVWRPFRLLFRPKSSILKGNQDSILSPFKNGYFRPFRYNARLKKPLYIIKF